ncbi:hypothetical protein Tco_1041892 [Tanacetum coccineum]|uniref:Reverse transcriptase domain-containing protein n=1 Tax=Tanacetum coccineum TaxID=301880 RepID=A0ABQ5GHE8_9ASTR
MEQLTTLCDMVGQYMQKKEEDKRIAEDQASKDRYWKIPICYDDDEDDAIAITPVLPIEEPDNSLSMGTKHLDNLFQQRIRRSNKVYNDGSILGEDIDYVDASPPDVEIISLEVVEIIVPEVGRIDDDILLTIKDDILREKLLNVNLLIAKIDALRDNPTPSSDVVTKSTSTFSNLFLERDDTFDNSIPESKTFRFNLEEISSGSPTTRSDLSLLDYKAFYVDNDHFKEKSSSSTTTHDDFSQYDSFTFDLSNDQFPPAYRWIEPDPGDLTSIDLGIRKNVSTTNVNVPLEDDQSSLFAYVDFPDCEDSRFCPSLELHILSFILGIRYPNLID